MYIHNSVLTFDSTSKDNFGKAKNVLLMWFFNSLTTRCPRPGPYIDHVLYGGPGPGPPLGEHLVNCRHGNIFCSGLL